MKTHILARIHSQRIRFHPVPTKWYISIFIFMLVYFSIGCRSSNYASGNQTTLVVGINTDPRHLDPRIGTDKMSYNFHRLIYSGLLQKDKSERLIGDLAQEWEWVSPTKLKFVLKKDITFHSGKPLTAHDIVATYESIFEGWISTPKRGAYRNFKSVKAVNTYEVLFELEKPDASALVNLTLGIVPRELARNPITHPIGTGPYRYVSGERERAYHLEAYPYYYGHQPYFRSLILRVIPDPTVRWLELMKGSIDIVVQESNPDVLVRKKKQIKVVAQPSSTVNYIAFQLEHPLLSDLRVRKAIAHALNVESIIHSLFHGKARRAYSLLYPTHWAYSRPEHFPEYNPEKSLRLLKELGYSRKHPLSFTFKTPNNPFSIEIAQILQAQLREVGISLSILPLEWGTFYYDVTHGQFEMYRLQWIGVSDPDIFTLAFHSRSFPPNGANRGRYQNKELDTLLDQARQLYDEQQRKKLYGKVQSIIARDLPIYTLWYAPNIALMQNNLCGFDFYPNADYYVLVALHPCNENINMYSFLRSVYEMYSFDR